MGEVVVVGAGLSGLSTAARLAKLGHRVTVCERAAEPGGLLGRVRHGGYVWDATPLQTTIPAVLRDLFRKSGRPIERYVDLHLSEPGRRHVLPDGTRIDLPTGSRAAQSAALETSVGRRAAAAWTTFVDDQADVWDALRSLVLDVPAGAAGLADRKTARALHARQSMDRLLRHRFDDHRLRALAAYPAGRIGRSTRDEPAFRAVELYVERTFGVWRASGGVSTLADALLTRMRERGVDLRFDSEVVGVATAGDRVTGVLLRDGRSLAADVVVTAVAPDQVFGRLLGGDTVAGGGQRTMSLLAPSRRGQPRSVTYLGLSADLPHLGDLPHEIVLHGDPLVVVFTAAGLAPPGGAAWAVVTHGLGGRDVLETLADRGLDIADAVSTRFEGGDASYPLPWAGVRVAANRAALARPLPALHCLGTGLVLGASIPYAAWQAAHLADLLGPAPRSDV